jgi:hypothetical protein
MQGVRRSPWSSSLQTTSSRILRPPGTGDRVSLPTRWPIRPHHGWDLPTLVFLSRLSFGLLCNGVLPARRQPSCQIRLRTTNTSSTQVSCEPLFSHISRVPLCIHQNEDGDKEARPQNRLAPAGIQPFPAQLAQLDVSQEIPLRHKNAAESKDERSYDCPPGTQPWAAVKSCLSVAARASIPQYL